MNSEQVRRQWADQSGEFSPEYYAYYGPNGTSESIRGIFDRFLDRDAAVLELGCSSGRHLSHLYEHGYDHLSGVDVNEDAFDVMRETYPDLAASGTFYLDAIEDVVVGFDDGQFDAVYSVETLQHLPPDSEWVFEELARVTADLLVTAEIEAETTHPPGTDPDVNYVNDEFPLYYHDWTRVFTDIGFAEVDVESTKRDTIRVFRSGQD